MRTYSRREKRAREVTVECAAATASQQSLDSQKSLLDNPADPYFFDSQDGLVAAATGKVLPAVESPPALKRQPSPSKPRRSPGSTLLAMRAVPSASPSPPKERLRAPSTELPPAPEAGQQAPPKAASSAAALSAALPPTPGKKLGLSNGTAGLRIPASKTSDIFSIQGQSSLAEEASFVRVGSAPAELGGLDIGANEAGPSGSQGQPAFGGRVRRSGASGDGPASGCGGNQPVSKRRKAVQWAPVPSSSASRGSAEAVNGSRPPAPRAPPPRDAGRSAAPPTTLHEAQESGEQTQILDMLMYALDGLAGASSSGVLRDSMATLAEVCASQRGRLAIRTEGMFVEVVAAARKACGRGDALLALAAAAALLGFARGEANQALLAGANVMALLADLLRDWWQLLPAGELGAGPGARIAKAVRDAGGGSGQLWRGPDGTAQQACPGSVALAALKVASDPHTASRSTEALKAAVREGGVLDLVVAALAGQGARSAWVLHAGLVVLENTTFAVPQNEAHLLGCRVPPPPTGAGHDPERALPAWLVELVAELGREPSGSPRAACLPPALAVLMNVTHNNADGCAAVVAAGGLEAAAGLLAGVLEPAQPPSPAADRLAVLAKLDLVSVALGLLINAVEACQDTVARLACLELPGSCASRDSQDSLDNSEQPGLEAQGSAPMRMLPLLCRLLQATGAAPGSEAGTPRRGSSPGLPAAVAGTGGPSPLARRVSLGEVTVDHLERSEDDGAASIVEVYAALLLGFMVARQADLRAEAAALLPGRGLAGVVAAVQRCYNFYVTTGSITDHNEASLRRLLEQLRGCGDGEAAEAEAAASQEDALLQEQLQWHSAPF